MSQTAELVGSPPVALLVTCTLTTGAIEVLEQPQYPDKTVTVGGTFGGATLHVEGAAGGDRRDTEASATAEIGTGANGTVTLTADPGAAGNSLTVEVRVPAPAATATADIGTGANGVVTVEAPAAGEDGNAYAIEVVNGVGISQALAVTYDAPLITVTLATDGGGEPDDAANTATLVAAAINAALDGDPDPNFDATASGDGSGVIAAEAAVPFTGGAGVLNQTLAADRDGDGLTVDLATDANGDPDDAANTATLVAAALDALDGVAAEASGTGADALDTAEGPTAFTGGADGVPSGTWTAVADLDGNPVTFAAAGHAVLRDNPRLLRLRVAGGSGTALTAEIVAT